MNGDTLEINPAAFKMKPYAVVEELLNQVSGITIWSDGTITVNGRKVQNLLVEGKPFMGSTDSRVATQNLPKSAIDKIQLYEEYDRSNIGREKQPQDSVLTMNIKLKESAKKGYFGKGGAGFGSTNRFESDLVLQTYNKKSSAGLGGGFNNINKNISNLQELFQNNTFRNSNPNLYSVGRFGVGGINKNHSLGTVVSHNFIETANSRQNNRIIFNYNTSGTDAFISDLNLQSRTTITNPQFICEEGTQNNLNKRHDASINYVKTNSYNDNLDLNGTFSTGNDRGNSSRYTEVRDSINALQSRNTITSQQRRQSDNAGINLSYAKSNDDQPLKRFNINLNARSSNSSSKRDVNSRFESLVNANQNNLLSRRYNNENHSVNVSGNLDYGGFKRLLLGRYNLFDIQLGFNQSFNYNRSSDQVSVKDFDTTAKEYAINNKLTNRNTRELASYTPTISLSKGFSKYSDVLFRSLNVSIRLAEEFKSDKNQSSFAKRNLERSFQFFKYDGHINLLYRKRDRYQSNASFNYSRSFDYPGIDQLYTIVDDINAYDIRMGNPELLNRINHNLSMYVSFNTQNPKAVYAINSNVNGGFSRSVNPITDSLINDPSGKRITYYINADKSKNLHANYSFNISRKFKKNQLQLMYNGQYSSGQFPNYIDGFYNVSETGNWSNTINLQLSVASMLVVNMSKTLQQYKTSQSFAKLTPFKNNNNITRLGVVLTYPAAFTFSSTLDHINNSNLARPTILWNAFATYRFMKQQGELKFSAMDILKQYQNITNSANAYGTATHITNGLQQYFLLTFAYYPRKFGKTELKKQGS